MLLTILKENDLKLSLKRKNNNALREFYYLANRINEL